MEGALSIRSARKIYDAKTAKVLALESIDLEIAAGEFCAVVGPSGCGKTTLLNAIAGFDTLTGGDIALDGEALASANACAPPDARRIVVFQNGALFPWRTVLWNVTCGPVMQRRLKVSQANEQAMELLARVGL